MSSKEQRNDMFQHLVLNGIWILVLLAFGKKPHKQALNWRSSAVAFGDLHGAQGEQAYEYRRDVTYWCSGL